MIIYIGTDHAGFGLKEALKQFLIELGYEIEDKGAYTLEPEDDYPDFIHPVAKAVAADPENTRGVILGGSGQAEAMIANRYKGVRAALYYGVHREIVKLSREHNNANVLSLAGRFIGEYEAKEALRLWLETPFSNHERHIRRIAKIDL